MPNVQLSNSNAVFWEILINWDPEAGNEKTLQAPNDKLPFLKGQNEGR